MKPKSDLDKFTDLADAILKVPHSEIKTKLDEEKAAKRKKKDESRTSKRQS
jgi:hypothetical protein